MKSTLIQLRNRLSASNRFRISSTSSFDNKANILGTAIEVVGRNEIIFEEGVRLRDLAIEIRGDSNRLLISSEARIAGRIELCGDGNTVTIGARTRISGAFLGAHNGTSIVIGSDCLFSTEIDIRTTDSHGIYDAAGRRINPDKDVVVADWVWLGLGVTVLKGSRIGADCVIGARALVAGDIPPNSVAAGIPAHVIKRGVTWVIGRSAHDQRDGDASKLPAEDNK